MKPRTQYLSLGGPYVKASEVKIGVNIKILDNKHTKFEN